MPTGRHGKLKLGIRTTRATGCVVQPDHPVSVPRKAQKPVEELELTFGQLKRLSEVHANCTPSLACLAEVHNHTPTEEEEGAALDAVNELRRANGLTRLG